MRDKKKGEKTMTIYYIVFALANGATLYALMSNHNETLVFDGE